MDSLGQKYLDSREVAEMVGKEHNKLLRDIRVYITQLNASKVGHTDFFTESQYTEKLNEAIPKMSDFDKGYILGKVENMAEKKKDSKESKKENK